MCDLWYYIGDEDQNKRQRQPSTNKPHNRLVLSAKRLTWRRPQERVKKIESQKSGYQPNKNNCGRCGNPSNHTTCPAMGASCKKCGKKNHYARVCLGKTKPPTEHRNHRSYQSRNRDRTDPTNFRVKHDYKATDKPQKGQTRRTRHVGHQSSDDSSSDDCFMHHLKTYHTSQDGQWKTCTIQINGVTIQAEPDSGSDTNIMDEGQFKKLQQQAPEVKIRDTKVKLKTLKEELPVIGDADVEMSNQTRTVCTSILGKLENPESRIRNLNY